MTELTKEQELAGLQKAYRTLPERSEIKARGEGVMFWVGDTKALLRSTSKSIEVDIEIIEISEGNDLPICAGKAATAHLDIKQTLIDRITELKMEIGSHSAVIEKGNVFDYHTETRKILESAKSEIFLIDKWVSADVVSDYFKVIDPAIKIRILTSFKQNGLDSIKPAAEKLNQQTGGSIEIRSTEGLHDRFWIIDGAQGYQSGSSIQDGAKKAAAVILEISDAFDAIQQMYEGHWSNGTVQIPLK